jgi:hypothetical protein
VSEPLRCPDRMPFWTAAGPAEEPPQCVDLSGHEFAHQALMRGVTYCWGHSRMVLLPDDWRPPKLTAAA